MRRLLEKIHRQPEHIRELWAAGCTLVVVVLVVTVWFSSFKSNIYALLNTDQQNPAQEQFFAAATPTSLFGSIISTFNQGKDGIMSLFGKSNIDVAVPAASTTSANPVNPGGVHALPVSGNK